MCLTRVAAADDSARVSLSWSAPLECPDEAELARRIEALIGRSLHDAGEQSLAVAASAQGNARDGYAAKVSFTSLQGTEARYLEHPQCDHLVQALALVIALAIDPEHTRAMQPEQTVAEASTAVQTAQNPVENAAPVASDATHETPAPVRAGQSASLHGARVAVRGLLGAGALPNLGFGVGAALGYRLRRFRADVVGRYWGPRDQTVSSTPSASIELRLATLGARGCWLPPLGAWQLAACAGADLGSMSGIGQGVENPRQRDALYADVVGGVQLARTQWRLSPEFGLEISGALARPRFGLVEDGRPLEEFRPAAWGLCVFAGLAFEL